VSVRHAGWSAAAAALSLALAIASPGCAQPDGSASRSAPPSPALFVDCRGERTAAPTVVLESGAFGTSADWDFVEQDLAPGGRVCAYDRAGLGASAPTDRGLDPIARAHELGDLLDALGEPGPVILVGHSNGALYVEAFARLWPKRVAGLVLVNGVGSQDLDDPRLVADLDAERRWSKRSVVMARLGLAPLVADVLTGEEGLRGKAIAHKRAALTCHACLRVSRDEDALVVPGLAQVAALPPLDPAIPVAVITGDPDPTWPLPSAWRKAEEAPARTAQHGWVLDAPGATHVSPLARDRAYVDAAVGWLRATYP
jgi:pimeloyl-ACP methyl ester carboxylesterase